ncbi:hypothetical protein SAMN05216375_12127 [Trichococcus ilyis]|uniref:Armadillo-type fold n=1 Tax=Trichococcus ilyis TaxID=640938 RepID=A0A143YZH0_9LACT|nr:hypothetical protein [Trichococcus ilyis]CZR02688.1 Hypothetical protein TR210_1926 [Trichococcus ilyis]SEJ66657.1 hypothetical protein SAMN05216375_12127 [Trichococcus ilyis]
MGKTASYRETLKQLEDWDAYLLEESRLPGPRGNLELVAAVAEEGDLELFQRYLAYDASTAPYGSSLEFLPVCGVVGLGRLLSEGQVEHLVAIRRYASDPRWRVREGVAMALQRYGEKDMQGLLQEMEQWSEGSLLEKRATAAAVCEPKLLKKPDDVKRVLGLLDCITASLLQESDRKSESFRVLQQALGYCWSVAVVADPTKGKKLMEKWFSAEDQAIRWIMRENLKKNRLHKCDAEWTERWANELERSTGKGLALLDCLASEDHLSCRNIQEWHDWLAQNHDQKELIWLKIKKAHAAGEGILLAEAVEEALCFGWIDGKMYSLDKESFIIRMTPRRSGSVWSLINRRRAEALLKAGRMTAAGKEAIQAAKASGKWQAAYSSKEVPDLPAELGQAFRDDPAAARVSKVGRPAKRPTIFSGSPKPNARKPAKKGSPKHWNGQKQKETIPVKRMDGIRNERMCRNNESNHKRSIVGFAYFYPDYVIGIRSDVAVRGTRRRERRPCRLSEAGIPVDGNSRFDLDLLGGEGDEGDDHRQRLPQEHHLDSRGVGVVHNHRRRE